MVELFSKNIFNLILFITTASKSEDIQTKMFSYSLTLKNHHLLEEQGDVAVAMEGVTVVIIKDCNYNMKKLSKSLFNISNTVCSIFVNKCYIEEIEVDFLNGLEISSTFSLNFNPIRNIRKHTFRNHGVEEINLSFNNITTIENEAFVNLFKLEQLSLNHNRIQRLRFEAFFNLPKLIFFLVAFNNIEKISRGCFQFIQQDKALISLNNNEITEVDAKAFENFTSKNAFVVFKNNYIEDLPKGLFDNHTFSLVDFSINKIRKIPQELCRVDCKIGDFFFFGNLLDEDAANQTFEWATNNHGFLKEFQRSNSESNSNSAGLLVVISCGWLILSTF
jgi:Leucine-rich repeat (LRR) protein